ncbi:MAG: reverse transcriptase-like protein [Pigmentiphaga sp.]|nr:reverse transcriptase-like protein [Pigmentiphaga sp.]
MRPPNKATVITDASFCPDTKIGTWAGWIKMDVPPYPGPIRGSGRLRHSEDSTTAEVMAAANGCYLAAANGASHILLQSDCMAVIHLVEGRGKAERLLAIWEDLMGRGVMAGVFITARHVKGHGRIHNARTWVNDWCDRTAYEIMRKARAEHRTANYQSHRQKRAAGGSPPERSNPSWSICPRP